jgi:ketosteroid isomerase-like protein
MNSDHMESYYRTYNTEDSEALSAFYHEAVELTSPAGVLRGRDEVLSMYRHLTATFDDKMTPLDIQIHGYTAVVKILDRLTAKLDVEDFLGMPVAAGECVELQLTGTYVFDKAGRFTHITIEPQIDT